MNTATPSAPPPPSELRVVNERLDTVQAFRLFVGRVSVRAGRWLASRGVPEADRDDILQEALLQPILFTAQEAQPWSGPYFLAKAA